MRKTPIPAQPEFLVQLRRTNHAVRVRLDADLEPTGLTLPQYLVLAALERVPELSASDLARELGVSAQTANVLVRGLRGLGLVRRQAHPNHGRILQTSLTDTGRRALQRGRELALSLEDEVLEPLNDGQRTDLIRALEVLEAQVATSNLTRARFLVTPSVD